MWYQCSMALVFVGQLISQYSYDACVVLCYFFSYIPQLTIAKSVLLCEAISDVQ